MQERQNRQSNQEKNMIIRFLSLSLILTIRRYSYCVRVCLCLCMGWIGRSSSVWHKREILGFSPVSGTRLMEHRLGTNGVVVDVVVEAVAV